MVSWRLKNVILKIGKQVYTHLTSPRWAGILLDRTINRIDGSPFTEHSGINTAAFLWSPATVTFLKEGKSYFWSAFRTLSLFSSDKIFSKVTAFWSYRTPLQWNNLQCLKLNPMFWKHRGIRLHTCLFIFIAVCVSQRIYFMFKIQNLWKYFSVVGLEVHSIYNH